MRSDLTLTGEYLQVSETDFSQEIPLYCLMLIDRWAKVLIDLMINADQTGSMILEDHSKDNYNLGFQGLEKERQHHRAQEM